MNATANVIANTARRINPDAITLTDTAAELGDFPAEPMLTAGEKSLVVIANDGLSYDLVTMSRDENGAWIDTGDDTPRLDVYEATWFATDWARAA